eukprot:gb/GFBE01035674.1/.p1 GENE.gb/GFBE01035674.1/~~gb/GFBE01035674.1/.p1  ORF type:complete len:147 (+),score=13.55 gb/GFBE01035674.1/:1-441(+)
MLTLPTGHPLLKTYYEHEQAQLLLVGHPVLKTFVAHMLAAQILQTGHLLQAYKGSIRMKFDFAVGQGLRQQSNSKKPARSAGPTSAAMVQSVLGANRKRLQQHRATAHVAGKALGMHLKLLPCSTPASHSEETGHFSDALISGAHA